MNQVDEDEREADAGHVVKHTPGDELFPCGSLGHDQKPVERGPVKRDVALAVRKADHAEKVAGGGGHVGGDEAGDQSRNQPVVGDNRAPSIGVHDILLQN